MKDKTITLNKNAKNILQPDNDSVKTIIELGKQKDSVSFKVISDGQARSIKQWGFYWAAWLPTFCNHIQGMENYVDIEKHNYENAHRLLSLKWAIAKERTDMIQTIPCLVNGKVEHVGIVSMSFGNCNQKDAQDFMDWVKNLFFKLSGVSIEDAIQNDNMSA